MSARRRNAIKKGKREVGDRSIKKAQQREIHTGKGEGSLLIEAHIESILFIFLGWTEKWKKSREREESCDQLKNKQHKQHNSQWCTFTKGKERKGERERVREREKESIGKESLANIMDVRARRDIAAIHPKVKRER